MGAPPRQPPAPVSNATRQPVYTRADVEALDYPRDTPDPGQFPYTRGLYPDGYRGKLWTMRQFAGFGTPEETNGRYRALLAAGGTGLSVAFDLPTLMGRDPDDELSLGEVGKCGVSVASLADMEALFAGIDLGAVSTSMTINGPASILFAMYLVVAERQGVAWPRLNGTLQNDILKEFIAQKEYIYPPRPVDAARHRHVFVLRRARAAVEQHLGQRVSHPGGRSDGRTGAGLHACATASSTCRPASMRAWMWTASRRGCRSSSTPRTTCWRKWRSSGRRAACGHA